MSSRWHPDSRCLQNNELFLLILFIFVCEWLVQRVPFIWIADLDQVINVFRTNEINRYGIIENNDLLATNDNQNIGQKFISANMGWDEFLIFFCFLHTQLKYSKFNGKHLVMD